METQSEIVGGLERLRRPLPQGELERLQAQLASQWSEAELVRHISPREESRFLNGLANVLGRILLLRPGAAEALSGLRRLASPEMPLGVRVAAVEALGVSETIDPRTRLLLSELATDDHEDPGLRQAASDVVNALSGD